MPTLIPPDRTLEAEAAAIPPCCDDSNLVIRTPSLTQVAVWTESAQALYPPTLLPGVPSTTPYPMGEFLPPSDEWVSRTYTDSVYSYSFEYPANWFIELDGNQTYVHNLSPGPAPKDQLDPHRIKMIVSPQKDGLEQYSSLEAYLSDPKHAVPADELIDQQAPEPLFSGYQAIRQERTAFLSNGGIVVIYITDGKAVYTVTVFDRNSLYLTIVDHLLDSFRILPPPGVPSTLPQFPPNYLAPSGEWAAFRQPTDGYSVEYPSNWFVLQQTDGVVAITNFPLNQLEKSVDNPERFRMDIYRLPDMGSYTSLADYVNAQTQPGEPGQVLSQVSGTTLKGYPYIRQDETAAMPSEVTVIYVTNGHRVYQIVGPSSSSNYVGVLDGVLDSFTMPG
jgi:hypothetical protein